MARAYVGIGSNIEPERNVRAAIRSLARQARVLGASTFYRTDPIGYPNDPRFINGVIAIETRLSAEALKRDVLREIERELGRRRGANPNAPRTIDLDLLLYAGASLDPNVEQRAFLAWPLLELEPALTLSDGRPLGATATHLSRAGMEPLHELTALLRSEVDDGRTEDRTYDQ